MKLPKGLNFIFLFLFICSTYSQQPQRQQSHPQRHHARRLQQLAKTRRIYAMCPPGFTKIGNECYFLSPSKASWLDSHFECKDKNGKLAEPLKSSDRQLRKYLLERGRTRGEIWIGGMYNWQRMRWQWGYNGKDMKYQSFSQMKPGGSEDLKYNCAVLNPDLKYRWSAKLCFEKHFYLCQHRMPYVSERSRQRIYAKWNETYPGQFANEIQVYVTTNGSIGNRREFYRATSKRPAAYHVPSPIRDQSAQASNQVPSMSRYRGVISNEINPPEVLSNRDGISQSKLRRNKKQQNQRARENKMLNLTGNVDLGRMNLKQNRPSRRKNGTRRISKTAATTQHPNTISEIFPPNHHRHNHYETRPQHHKPDEPETSTATPVTYRPETTTSRKFSTPSTTTINPPTSTVTASSTTPMSAKEVEKKRRLDNIRQKLSSLSDEQKLEFMKLKAERKALRSKQSSNDTIQ